ncbi:hypothetical protein MTO96_028973 [Rhipicephalus appendiculatus]
MWDLMQQAAYGSRQRGDATRRGSKKLKKKRAREMGRKQVAATTGSAFWRCWFPVRLGRTAPPGDVVNKTRRRQGRRAWDAADAPVPPPKAAQCAASRGCQDRSRIRPGLAQETRREKKKKKRCNAIVSRLLFPSDEWTGGNPAEAG